MFQKLVKREGGEIKREGGEIMREGGKSRREEEGKVAVLHTES